MATRTKVVSPVVAELERTWSAIARRHKDLPAAALVVASGTMHRRANQFVHGHHAALRWVVGDAELAEVLVAGERLKDGAAAVLGTLLHEAAHGLGDARGKRTTSRQGRYHNDAFRELALEVGLVLENPTGAGWNVTDVPARTLEVYARELERLEAALLLHRRAELDTGARKKTSSKNLAVAECDCPRKIRVARSTLELAPIICGACGGDFTAAADEDAGD